VLRYLNLIINVLRALDTTEKHIVKFEELKARCKICKIQA